MTYLLWEESKQEEIHGQGERESGGREKTRWIDNPRGGKEKEFIYED